MMEKRINTWLLVIVAGLLIVSAYCIGKTVGNNKLPKENIAYQSIFYREAVELLEKENYDDAISYLIELNGYRNSDELLAHALEAKKAESDNNSKENEKGNYNWLQKYYDANENEIVTLGSVGVRRFGPFSVR